MGLEALAWQVGEEVPAPELVHERARRLTTAITLALPPDHLAPARLEALVARALELHLDPMRARRALEAELEGAVGRVILTGTVEQRVLLLERGAGTWVAASLGPTCLGALPWPGGGRVHLAAPHAYVSPTELDEGVIHRLLRPRVTLVSLYHPEVFPLPRFALGISDLARAVRSRLKGSVTLCDMQLGQALDDVVAELARDPPDVLGISATFGQQDVLDALMEKLAGTLRDDCLVVMGGSLSALNAEHLLARYPKALVARGPGEATMQDVVAYWLGELPLTDVRDISYKDAAGRTRRTTRLDNTLDDILPELDLLQPTLEHHGVMQLESSRGCTHACSFCPRDHKGVWNGDEPEHMARILGDIARVYDGHPHVARKIFLVDEEFVGRATVERAAAVCKTLFSHGFRFETSSRVDQVYREDRNAAWHVERIRFWQYMRDHGLDRCLFGVESGVDSILRRFNKRTTSRQNVLALRLLSASGVPIRCTYITFDQLMTFEELLETYLFQGRTDILLDRVDLPPQELFEAVQDEDFVKRHGSGRSFYERISYMLVSMECLTGSPYLKLVEAAGLAREHQPAMGRRNAEYQDARLGLMSQWSQRWIDRSFSFDYTLKSVEKLTAGAERTAVRRLRAVLKRWSYELLGGMLSLASDGDRRILERLPATSARAAGLRDIWCQGPASREQALAALCDAHFLELVRDVETTLADIRPGLAPQRADLILREMERWQTRTSWELINA